MKIPMRKFPVLSTIGAFKLVMMLLLLIVTGCSETDPIRQYTVMSIDPAVEVADSGTSDQVWFFKLMGPKEKVDPHRAQILELLEGTKFEAGRPVFTVPEGWTVTDGPPPRDKTITIAGTEPPIELSLSSLPAPSPSEFSTYLLSNVNRWRGQIGLAPETSQNWAQEAEKREELMLAMHDGYLMSILVLEGESPEHGETRMLAALYFDTKQAESVSASPDTSPPRSPSSNVDYDLPPGWQESPGDQFSLLAFTVGPEGEDAAKVTVTKLNGGGDIASNVNRWRAQVGLSNLSDNELNDQAIPIEVAGLKGSLWEMEGPEESILGAIVEEGSVKWFYKMVGPTEIVALEKENFQSFLSSLKFE